MPPQGHILVFVTTGELSALFRFIPQIHLLLQLRYSILDLIVQLIWILLRVFTRNFPNEISS